MDTIKIGFLGAGDIADLHAEAVNDLQGAELVGIWNRTHEKAVVSHRLPCKKNHLSL